jgi:hypothetical protein
MKTLLFLGTEGLENHHLWLATTRMAPTLAPSKHEFIYDMICSGELSISEMAEAAGVTRVPS